MASYGSEEFYRNSPYQGPQNPYQDQTPLTIEILREQTRRKMEEGQQLNQLTKESAESAKQLGSTISELPGRYQQAQVNKADIGLKSLQTEEARAKMDEYNRMNKFKQEIDTENPNRTREQQAWYDELQDKKISRRRTEAELGQMALQNKVMQNEFSVGQEDRARKLATETLTAAYRSGDPQKVEQAKAQLAGQGINASNLSRAEEDAKTNLIKSGTAADEVFALGGVGQIHMEGVNEIKNNISALQQLELAKKNFDESLSVPGIGDSSSAKAARQQAIQAARQIGVPEVQIQNAWTTQAFDEVINTAKRLIDGKLRDNETIAQKSGSVKARNTSATLRDMLNRSGSVGGNLYQQGGPQQTPQTMPAVYPGQQQQGPAQNRVSPLR